MTDRDEQDQERRVLDVVASQHWDASPYSVALELKRLLLQIVDADTSIDSGTGLLWPFGAPSPIEGHAEADLYPRIGGIEFYVTIRKSNMQLLKEGVTREQLGLPEEPPNNGPGLETPR